MDLNTIWQASQTIFTGAYYFEMVVRPDQITIQAYSTMSKPQFAARYVFSDLDFQSRVPLAELARSRCQDLITRCEMEKMEYRRGRKKL